MALSIFLRDYQTTIVVHIFFWILGITTVRYWKSIDLIGPRRLYYPMCVILVCVGSRIERIIDDDNFLKPSLEMYVYLSMKTLETLAPICILVCEMFWNKHDKVIVYNNLYQIDKKLNVKPPKYTRECMKLNNLIIFYIVITLIYYSSELYTWHKGIHQFLLALKLVITDSLILQFGQEVYFTLLRLRSINEWIKVRCQSKKYTKVNVTISFDEVNLVNHNASLPSASEVSEKEHVLCLIEAYDKMIDNVRNMGRRVSLHVLLVSLMAVLVIMTSANMFAAPGKYSQINYISAFISMFLWQMRYVMYFVCATLCTEMLVKETSNTRRLLGKYSLCCEADRDVSMLVKRFITIAKHEELRVYIWQLFPLDFTLFHKFIGLAATYSIILIQMTSL